MKKAKTDSETAEVGPVALPAPVDMAGETNRAAAGLTRWVRAYRVELLLFSGVFIVLAMFSSQRFWRQSAAPQFVYQSKAFLEGHLTIDPEVLPNLEDWACAREVNGVKVRCEGAGQQGDLWYSSFPWFPSVVMAPFVLINGYQLNDTSFGIIIAALAIALFYSLLRLLREHDGSTRTTADDVALALLLCFGTLFFYASLRGEVWFSAEVMGAGLTVLYLRNAVRARHPILSGLFWSMAVLTRTPLIFTGLFFVLEAAAPEKGQRLKQLMNMMKNATAKRALFQFFAAAAPLGVIAAVINQLRFGRVTEFGHRFLVNNRVNHDIDTFGLFHLRYLERNLDAAFLELPTLNGTQLHYSPWGLTLFLTLPFIALAFVPQSQQKRAWAVTAAMGAVLVGSLLLPLTGPASDATRPMALLFVLTLALTLMGWFAWQWLRDAGSPRLLVPVLLTLAACAGPGLLYQNTGYAQFGFRFSIDYTPYVMLLVALGGWSYRKPLAVGIAVLAVLVNFWGAIAFRGYTEQVRNWL